MCITPAGGSAATVGAELPGAFTGTQGCGTTSCLFAQRTIGSTMVRAPFSGTARKLRIQGPNGSFGLSVLKERPGDEYKHVRTSGLRAMSGGTSEVVKRNVNLRVKAGNYLAVEVPMGSTIGFAEGLGPSTCYIGLVPPPALGDSSTPHSGYSGCGEQFLFNVQIRR